MYTTITSKKNNPKKLYKLINHLTGNVTQNRLLDSNSGNELANRFAKYFRDKIDKIRETFERIPPYKPPVRDDIPSLTKFEKVTETDMANIINSMQMKNCKLDRIPTKILKNDLPSVLRSLTHIINLLLDQGKFDKEWKTAVVKPLQKKQGNNTNEINYRPISNLSFISKVTEKAMLQQLLDHAESSNLIPEYQSAYRPFHSCETSLLKPVNDILIGMENHRIKAQSVMDLLAAFNTVPNDSLLEVLNCRFRIEETALQCTESYLRPQFFRVSINKEYSDTKEVTCSVPQGLAAGANLFTCYVSTLEETLADDTELELNGFADNHSIRKSFNVKSRKEEHTVFTAIERLMLKIKKWMDAVRLKMNESKTEFMLLGSRPHLKRCTTNSLKVLEETLRNPKL